MWIGVEMMTGKQAGPDEEDSQSNASAQGLRKRAEEKVRKAKSHFAESWLPPTARELLHELRVSQIELEMQNEELLLKQEELETSRDELLLKQEELETSRDELLLKQEELKNSREKYFDLYNLAPVGYLSVGEDGLILDVNNTISTLFGAAKNLLINKPLTSLIAYADQDVYYMFRKRLFETGKPQACELRLVRRDGSQFWAGMEATVSRDAQSRAIVCQAVVSDITEPKKAQNSLQETHSLLDEVQRLSKLGGWKYESSTGHITWTDEVYRIHGVGKDYDPSDANNNIGFYSPEDIPAISRAFARAVNYGEPYDLELRLIRKNAERIWVRTIGKPVIESGKVVRVTGNIIDITDRKRAEIENTRLATAVTHAADAVVITDAEGVIEYVNPAFEKTTGYSLAEIRGQNPRLLKSGQHEKTFYEELWETIKSGRVWRGAVVNRKKDGSLYEEEMTISPIADATGAIVNFVAVKRDNTREAILKKSRDYFTTITAHELRTPLMKLLLLKNMLDQAQTAGLTDEQMQTAQRALLEAVSSFDRIVKATSLISDMSLTDPDKRFGGELIYYNVAEALEEAQDSIAEARRNIAVETDMTGLSRGAVVMGNHVMIRQALDETLSNAIKYTPDGKTIRVRASGDGVSVHIEIADEGLGIPEERLEDLLIPYYSLEDPLNHSTGRYKFQGGGLGLGLTVVKLIMDYHKGRLAIANRPDRSGALVTLSFPQTGEEAL
ncbi:MAG: PAS domain S-box protein [Nitrospinae bacterium]|nr:PAS domain S-box protein [Nitrospinota bacterium]